MYFSRFPIMVYDIKGDREYKLLPNILRRVKIRAGIKAGSLIYDQYNVQDGERPEDIAYKVYGDPEFHWVILITNNITDRYYQWPMTQPQFQNFIEDKYGIASIDSIHHYEITQTSGRTTSNGPNDYSYLVECNSDEDGASPVTNREYEQRLQDKFRSIRLLDTKYLRPFVEEFERLIEE